MTTTDNRGYTELSTSPTPDVPYWFNTVVNEIDVDVQQVAEVAEAASTGVTTEAAARAAGDAAAKWNRPALTNGTNLDTLSDGTYPIVGFTAADSMTPKPPILATSNYEHRTTAGNNAYQRQDSTGRPFQSWERRKDGGVWQHPRRIDPPEPLSQMSLSRSAGTAYYENATDGMVRFPFRVGTPIESFMFNIENFDDRTNTAYTGAVTITSVWIGEAELVNGEMTGKFLGNPTQVLTSFALPANGVKYTSVEITRSTFKIDPHKAYLIAFGFTTDGAVYHRSYGGCWRNGLSAQAGSTNPNTLQKGKFAPFSTWLSIRARAPRVAFIGDSHGTGNNADLPVFQSPINLYCLANGSIPINLSHGGSTLNDFRSVNQYKYQKYAVTLAAEDSRRSFGQATVRADAVIIGVGQNGPYNNGTTLAQLQDDYLVTTNAIRSIFGPNIYAATIMPRNGAGLEAYDAIRIQYNDWLRTLPGMAVGCIDFAAAVADPANASRIDSRYVDPVDLTHLNTAGCNRLALAIPSGLGRNVTY